jgi:hypothetical protein
MKKLAALAVIASLFALSVPDTGAEAKTIKLRVKDRHNDNWKLSCNTARHMVRERGYKLVKTKSCITPVYQFWVIRKGRTFIVYVDPRTRSVWQG